MRRLLLILFPLLFVAPAYAQTDPTNPTPDETCGLPKEGTIVATVTYTLKANCTQTGTAGNQDQLRYPRGQTIDTDHQRHGSHHIPFQLR